LRPATRASYATPNRAAEALLKLFHEYRNAYPDYLRVRFLTPAGEEDARAAGIASERLRAPPDPDVASLAANAQPLLLRLDAASAALLLYRRVCTDGSRCRRRTASPVGVAIACTVLLR
jgi:hypothetical protein